VFVPSFSVFTFVIKSLLSYFPQLDKKIIKIIILIVIFSFIAYIKISTIIVNSKRVIMNIKVKRKIKKAFTLIEMTVVIIIIATLISIAAITGSAFIDNGKAQSFIYELTGYRQNIKKFYDTYHALPGDFNGASSDINAYLMNGNGNGKYDIDISNECYSAWQHMSYAGILPEKFVGTSVSKEFVGGRFIQQSKPGVNVPRSKIFPNAGYRIGSNIPNEISQNSIMGKYNIILEFMQYDSFDEMTGRGKNGAINPIIMQNIDTKIDDGKPIDGFLVGLNDANNLCNLSTSNVNLGFYSTSPVTYLDSKEEGCIVSLILNEY